MNENPQMGLPQKIDQAAKRIDEIAKDAMQYFDQAGSMESELAVARAVGDLRAALTAEVMKPIMDLMNTTLGFDTDRNPTRPTYGKPAPIPYSLDVVREFVIEAKLRGFHLVGQECNIISGRFYACKSGVVRKARNWEGVSDLNDSYEVPRRVTDGAIVKCSATWKRAGKTERIDREFPIRVNEHMGVDAILGKAQRKLFAAIIGKLSGRSLPEGDAEDAEQIANAPAPAQTTRKATPESQTIRQSDSSADTDWREVKIPDGPQRGKLLGELEDAQMRWYCESRNPKEDKAFEAALAMARIELDFSNPPPAK